MGFSVEVANLDLKITVSCSNCLSYRLSCTLGCLFWMKLWIKKVNTRWKIGANKFASVQISKFSTFVSTLLKRVAFNDQQEQTRRSKFAVCFRTRCLLLNSHFIFVLERYSYWEVRARTSYNEDEIFLVFPLLLVCEQIKEDRNG